ncbi:MAG: aspartate--tRNA ligase [Clostridiales bacterium]|jgi:aspartyl-tRNA synthetase|nr:aspartate--tRNA ligase [Clostridiales bacterium]
MDNLVNFKRTGYCGNFRLADRHKEVSVCGWVQRVRDLGGLLFIDLRDRTGILQLAFDDNTPRELFKKASQVKPEYVLAATGRIRERSSKNKEIPTGDIEVEVTELRILAVSETPPFEITENCATNEATRMKHRYLDLRRPNLQRNIMLRHRVAKLTRDYFDENGFIEIETPILIKSTPEGARDYLVPSRLHKGKFYALPQSPQLYKQLSMVAGFDRYIQLARSFRDEDSRADRQPEFTQIDLEMSFVDMDDIIEMVEGYLARLFGEIMGMEIDLPLPRMTYREAMERFGTDKPDTRYTMEIFDISDLVSGCDFRVFTSALEEGGSVRGICAKNSVNVLSRKELDKLTDYIKGIGGKGIAWIRLTGDGVTSSFSRFMTEDEIKAIVEKAGAEEGDVVLIISDGDTSNVLFQLGSLRTELAKKLDLIPKGVYNLLWIVEIPFFEYDKETGQYVAMHHPFTSPMDECTDYLETEKSKVRAKAWDLVLNGIELSSGSIRITNPELQSRIFRILGLSEEEARRKFGYLLDAFKYGAPPHGGMGIGLDRLVMQLLECDSLRDVIAFPKLQNASEPMTDCPDVVDDAQLEELGLSILE